MAHGFQVFDANGRLVVDLNQKVGRIYGSVYTGSTAGSVMAQGMRPMPQGFYYLVSDNDGLQGPVGLPVVTITNDTVSWTFPRAPVNPSTIFYGML